MTDFEKKRAATIDAWKDKDKEGSDAFMKSIVVEKKQSPYWRAFHWFNLILNIVGGALIGPVSVFLPCK
jgi:drug/metabolite transporter (DMT)-like permease